MKAERPVFLNVLKVQLPVAAVVSILHRISGVFLFVASGFFLWLFAISVHSEQGFNDIKQLLTKPMYAFILWICLSLVGYHLIAGVRHLLLDLHIGDSLQVGKISAYIVLISAIIASVLFGVWLWL
ncbi:MAG: succinate dehydrogenase, cytochrome b556 subunit [Gammaproteobacteria bacterium]|nr:succinate dehydrogenase, cytochrome b556 subunit [Gammaproteobacteria bacterium]